MRKIIKEKGPTQRSINPKLVAKALSAEDTGIVIDTKRVPISLFALRQFIADRLYSTGGRPKLKGTRKVRNKISFFDEDWEKLKAIAGYYKEKEGINVSSSQIASALIHAEISKIKISIIKSKSRSALK